MTTARSIATSALLLGLIAAPLSAGDTYTFNQTDDVWNNQYHWDKSGGGYGIPGPGDTAVIPSGKTCRIENDDQEAEIVQVYGTLGLVGKDLILGENETPTTSTVDGTVYFEQVSTVKGTLLVRDWVTFDGDGELTASKGDDSDYAGWIGLYVEQVGEEPPYQYIVRGDGIILDDTIVLTGTVALWCRIEITEYAVILVDHADDVFDVGGTYGMNERDIVLDGAGKFDVDAGELEIGWVVFDATTPRWELSGGEIELIDVPTTNSTFVGLTVQIDMSGGTLDIDDPFSTTGAFTFGGGTIELAYGKSATFE